MTNEVSNGLIEGDVDGDAPFFVTGEGLFLNYPFTEGGCYKISFLISRGNATASKMEMYAANGLVHNTSGSCSEAIPTISDKELIEEITTSTLAGGFHETFYSQEVYYSPDSDYDQFWVYHSGGGANTIMIDNLEIEAQCVTSLVFDDPVRDIPAATYNVSSFIKTTSSTSSFIENAPSEVTNFRAGSYILLETSTLISVSGNGKFTAVIETCTVPSECSSGGSGGSRVINDDNIESEIRLLLLNDSESIKPLIHPNPATNSIWINIPKELMRDQSNSHTYFVVYNSYGRIIKTKQLLIPEKPIDLSYLPSGMYIIQITLGERIFTEKLILE